MTVRAKFRVNRIERSLMNVKTGKDDSGRDVWGMAEVQTIVLNAVTGQSTEENEKFFASTPTGEIKVGTVSAEAAAQFELNKEYYVDFTPAE